MDSQTILASSQIPNINRGLLDEEMGQAITEVVQAVLRHGKKGRVTVKLDISLQSYDQATVKILHDVKAVPPKEKSEGGILFAYPSGKLSQDDPRQAKLDLKPIPNEVPQLKVAK